MSLSPSVLSSLIKSNLQANGAQGYNLQKFCDALAQGILSPIIGATFITSDSGLVSGSGNGAGIGIMGLSPSIIASLALADMFSRGSNAGKLMQSIADATVTHLSTSATLVSTDAPVYSGTGIIVIGSIPITVNEMTSTIDGALSSQGAHGRNRTKLAHAIATGIVTNIISSGTGTLTITGTGIPTGSGTGTGTGEIS
jgi:hypothetical protein